MNSFTGNKIALALLSLAILARPQTDNDGLFQPPTPQVNDKNKNKIEIKDVNVIIAQIFSCPAWDEIDKGDIAKIEPRIIKCLDLIAKNDITLIREAVRILMDEYPQETSLWSRIFLLNRYLFKVPEKSPIDGKLFGGWAGAPIKDGTVNRLWPFTYDKRLSLRLVGEFEGYYGPYYKGLDEFDYFRKTFELRKKSISNK